MKEGSSARPRVGAETAEDVATEAGTATVRAIREASENAQGVASEKTREVADATRERLDVLKEDAAEQAEAAVGAAAISASETAEGAVANAVERVAAPRPTRCWMGPARTSGHAAEKLQEAAEKLDGLATPVNGPRPRPMVEAPRTRRLVPDESRPPPAAPRPRARRAARVRRGTTTSLDVGWETHDSPGCRSVGRAGPEHVGCAGSPGAAAAA